MVDDQSRSRREVEMISSSALVLGLSVFCFVQGSLIRGYLPPPLPSKAHTFAAETSKPSIVLQRNAIVGESPVWEAQSQCLFYVDIFGSSVNQYCPNTKSNQSQVIEGGVPLNLIIPVDGSPTKAIVARGLQVIEIDWDTDSNEIAWTPLYTLSNFGPEFGLNDGKVDSQGRLWVGVYESDISIETIAAKQGQFLRLNDGEIDSLAEGYTVPNGLAWSGDGKILFSVDSFARRVYGFDFDQESGSIGNRRVVFEQSDEDWPEAPGFFFDGMTIDTNDHLWIAAMGTSRLLEVDPSSGEMVNSIEFPAKYVTSAAFGGENMRDLYVTSASFRDEVDNPLAGSLFVLKNLVSNGREVTGIPHNLFPNNKVSQNLL